MTYWTHLTLFLWSLDHNSFRFWSVASVFELTELELSNESDFGVSVTICSSFGFFSVDDDISLAISSVISFPLSALISCSTSGAEFGFSSS